MLLSLIYDTLAIESMLLANYLEINDYITTHFPFWCHSLIANALYIKYIVHIYIYIHTCVFMCVYVCKLIVN